MCQARKSVTVPNFVRLSWRSRRRHLGLLLFWLDSTRARKWIFQRSYPRSLCQRALISCSPRSTLTFGRKRFLRRRQHVGSAAVEANFDDPVACRIRRRSSMKTISAGKSSLGYSFALGDALTLGRRRWLQRTSANPLPTSPAYTDQHRSDSAGRVYGTASIDLGPIGLSWRSMA